MTHGMSFIEGTTFSDMMHHAGNAATSERSLQTTLDLIAQIDNLRERIAGYQEGIRDSNHRVDAREGLINLTNEEVDLREMGVIDNSKGRLSACRPNRDAVKEELVTLAAKVDENLAAKGGRFSGRRIDNLREVLYMRIDEFFEYGEKHRLLHPNTKTVYSDDLKASMTAEIQQKSKSIGRSPESLELLLLQLSMNKMYARSYDANGERPEDYSFKPVNLIAAIGLTVAQLCKHAEIEEENFVGQPLADPPFDKSIFDKENDAAAAVLQVEYAALENEVDIKIRASKLLPDAESMLERVNETFPDLKGRVAAKISIIKYLELQTAIHLEPKKPGAGR
jgi:hypothetical protein